MIRNLRPALFVGMRSVVVPQIAKGAAVVVLRGQIDVVSFSRLEVTSLGQLGNKIVISIEYLTIVAVRLEHRGSLSAADQFPPCPGVMPLRTATGVGLVPIPVAYAA